MVNNLADKKIEILLKLIPQIQQWKSEKLPFPLICRKLENIFKEKYQIDYPYLSIKSRLQRWLKKKTFSWEKENFINPNVENTLNRNNNLTNLNQNSNENIPVNRFLLGAKEQQALREKEKQNNSNNIKVITDNNGISREVGTINLYGSNQFVE